MHSVSIARKNGRPVWERLVSSGKKRLTLGGCSLILSHSWGNVAGNHKEGVNGEEKEDDKEEKDEEEEEIVAGKACRSKGLGVRGPLFFLEVVFLLC